LFFLVFLPPSLIAQQKPTPPAKASEFGPLLPFSETKGGQVPLEINSVNTYYRGGIAIADIDVVIRYGDATMYCDHAEYNADSRDIFLKGNVKFFRGRYAFFADRAVYNTLTKELKMADFGGPKQPFEVVGDDLLSLTENQYTIFNGFITTSDTSKPDYQLRAKQMRIYGSDRIILSNVTLFLGQTPVFWFPYIYQSLNNQFSYNLEPGYNSTWGAYLNTSITFPIATNVSGTAELDLRSLRGPALGLNVNFKFDNLQTTGRLQIYGLNDLDPNINETALDRAPITAGRYRILYQSRTYVASDLLALVDFNKLSDRYFLQDFYPGLFNYDPQPDTYTELVKSGEAYTLTALTRVQVNNFQETVERLPDLSWEVARTPLFNGPIFYEATNSGALLHRAFEAPTGIENLDIQNGALNPDYQIFRLDSFHQLTYPHTYFGFLSLVPNVGIRGTYFSRTGSFVESDVSNPLPQGQLTENGPRFRFTLNAGVEASFKLSRAYEGIQQRWLGLDGLRHVVQPYADFSWVSSPTVKSSDILPFDQYIPSTDRQPIDFPEFVSTDSIDRWTILRLGIRNRLQTRRDNSTLNWLDVDSHFDVNFDNPLAQTIPPGVTAVSRTNPLAPSREPFSNVFNKVRLQPVPWFALSVDSQIPLLNKGFWQINTYFDWLLNPNIEFRIGHQYLQSNPFFQDASEVSLYSYLRLNDNWGFSIYEDYDFKAGILNQQTYAIHRDLSSWVGALGLNIKNNGSGKQSVEVVLSFTLKELPRFGSPLRLSLGSTLGE
jgi:lipopolysaccharide assembly outer membrane protein LptD (OstA)